MIVTITISGATNCLSTFDEYEITEILCDKLGIDDFETEISVDYEDE